MIGTDGFLQTQVVHLNASPSRRVVQLTRPVQLTNAPFREVVSRNGEIKSYFDNLVPVKGV